MSQWGSSDSGILRKNRADENLDQLLVFGYSCKIFRDDEKALYIDQGKHLIPWMGDETLKIDRYDGRGTLPDIKQFEASREGYDALRWLGLNDSEKKLEELCDSERYYSLEINEEEEEMYKEEATKRQKTNAFAFNYDNTKPLEQEQKEGIPTVPEREEEDEPYKPSPVLDVPVDINMPKTVKEYARIEKTALFVCRQGPQMEILIKAKQADNPQFSFLTVQDSMYKFYRHVLSAFKNGRYQPQCEKKPEEPKSAASQDEKDQDSHYLHPSLVSTSAKPVTPAAPQNPPIPTVPYRPSADCSYSQLVNRIQGAGFSSNGQSVAVGQQQGADPNANQMQLISQMNLEQQYHQYYYVQQFYEYWRNAVVNSEQGALYAGLPMNFSQLDPNMQTYIHQLAWAQFVQHHTKQMQETQQANANNNNSYAQIVSNLNKDSVNPYTANVPQLPPADVAKEETKVNKPSKEAKTEERTVTLVKYEENEVKKPLLSLAAAYGSESENDSDASESERGLEVSGKRVSQEQIEVYRVPSGEIQTVIDKMAEYVSKNGEQFEDVIKQKGDSRFDFLYETHEFNKYYRSKLWELKGGEPKSKKVKRLEESKPKTKTKKVITPVSFSIKKPKEEVPKDIKSALPMEDSSEEEENYLDNAPKSPSSSSANNGNSVAQKVPANSKKIYKIGQSLLNTLPQPKAAQVGSSNEGTVDGVSASDKMSPSKEHVVASSRETRNSPKRRSKSLSSSPRRVRRSRTPKKRSRSRTKSPTTSKRAKSRSKTPNKKSPTRARYTPAKNARLSPVDEQNRAKKKKSPAIDMFEADDGGKSGDAKAANGIFEPDDPILEMLELANDQRTAEEKAADAKEKARQLERKRKAAMFLKLKSVEAKPLASALSKEGAEKTSPAKSGKCCVKSDKDNSKRSPTPSISSRRNSEDSVITIRSRSRTREKSKVKERLPKEKSRSKSKESSRSSRRSRSKERRKDSRKHKKAKDRDRSRSESRDDDDRKKRKEKRKKSHKRKHSKSQRKSKKHKRSRSPSTSRSKRRSTSKSSGSSSVKSHISIDSS